MKNFLGWRYRQDLTKQAIRKEWSITIGLLSVIVAATIRFITL